ncbi:MAG: DUF3795 domain-containing protein [Dehalococcoidales bacterium]
MEKGRIYSKCGFYCNHCPAYKDNSGTKEDRMRGSAVWEKYFGLHFKPDIVKCEGCQSSAPWKARNLLPDRACPIRACAVYNEVLTCAHCSLFPCAEYAKRVPGSELRRQREKAANSTFTDDEYQKYIEPFEGQVHLKELRSTLKLEELIPPKQFSVGVNVTPFPINTNLTPEKEKAMRQLHLVLGNILSTKAANYVDQLLMERKKPYLWVLLWVMGLYGELREENLVLESAAHRDRIECSRLVRKRDNSLYEPIQDAVERLRKSGIQIEFKPSKRDWMLTLGVDKSIGGSSIITALKSYVSNLVKKYGEPIYTGSYNLKGEAFKLFTRVDMRDI